MTTLLRRKGRIETDKFHEPHRKLPADKTGKELMDWKATQETIAQAIAKVVELRIETTVIDMNNVKRTMETKIQLVAGDITNSIDREFVVGELTQLRAFHETQVLKAQQIIKDNLEALKTLWELVKEASSN